jgi:hypothetical protein
MQLKTAFFFEFNDKINMVFCLLILFIVVSMCCYGYLLIQKYLTRTSGYVFIDGMKNNLKSYIYISLSISCRCLFAGMVHSILYNYKDFQNILLLLIDMLSMRVIFTYRSQFDSRIKVLLY